MLPIRLYHAIRKAAYYQVFTEEIVLISLGFAAVKALFTLRGWLVVAAGSLRVL